MAWLSNREGRWKMSGGINLYAKNVLEFCWLAVDQWPYTNWTWALQNTPGRRGQGSFVPVINEECLLLEKQCELEWLSWNRWTTTISMETKKRNICEWDDGSLDHTVGSNGVAIHLLKVTLIASMHTQTHTHTHTHKHYCPVQAVLHFSCFKGYVSPLQPIQWRVSPLDNALNPHSCIQQHVLSLSPLSLSLSLSLTSRITG